MLFYVFCRYGIREKKSFCWRILFSGRILRRLNLVMGTRSSRTWLLLLWLLELRGAMLHRWCAATEFNSVYVGCSCMYSISYIEYTSARCQVHSVMRLWEKREMRENFRITLDFFPVVYYCILVYCHLRDFANIFTLFVYRPYYLTISYYLTRSFTFSFLDPLSGPPPIDTPISFFKGLFFIVGIISPLGCCLWLLFYQSTVYFFILFL